MGKLWWPTPDAGERKPADMTYRRSEEQRRPWVYIASPYSKGDQAQNVRFQLEVWDRLFTLGFVPIAPLWSHFQHLHQPRPYKDWTRYDNEIIVRCDACLRLDATSSETCYIQRESSGADAEVELFKKLGKPVFHSVDELLTAFTVTK
jgi:hypothetical protein